MRHDIALYFSYCIVLQYFLLCFFLYFTALYCVKYCDTCNTSYYIVIYSIALWYDFTYLYQSFCSITFHFYCFFHHCCYFDISIVNKINYLITMIIIIISLLHHHIKILNTITPFNLFIIIFLIFNFFIFLLSRTYRTYSIV